MIINGFRASHRNKWLLVSEGVLTVAEMVLLDFYIDKMNFSAKSEDVGTFDLDFAELEIYLHRKEKTPHPLIKEFGVDAIPYEDERMDTWRNTFKGIEYLHEPTNLLITGAIDDVWINREEELIIVDYKATSKESEVNIDAEWQRGYKRQMEIYQWLFKMNGFKVSSVGYFVYCNGDVGKPYFDKKLEFNIKVIPYKGETNWIEKTLLEIKECLMQDNIPEMNPDCDYCNYRKNAVMAKIKHERK